MNLKVDNSSQLLQLLLMSQLLGSASNNSSDNQGFQTILNTMLESMENNNSSTNSSANSTSGLSFLSGLSNLSTSEQASLMTILSEMSAVNTINSLGSTDDSDDSSDSSGGFNMDALNLNGLSGLNLASLAGGSSQQNQQVLNSFISGIKDDVSSGNMTIDQAVEKAANKYGVDKNLIMAVIKQESSFNPDATSSAGAMGLMQLMPGTAEELGVTNAYDIQQNVDGGTKYLKNLLDMYGNCKELALAAYNAGPNTLASDHVDNASEIDRLPSETRNYVSQIMKNYGK